MVASGVNSSCPSERNKAISLLAASRKVKTSGAMRPSSRLLSTGYRTPLMVATTASTNRKDNFRSNTTLEEGKHISTQTPSPFLGRDVVLDGSVREGPFRNAFFSNMVEANCARFQKSSFTQKSCIVKGIVKQVRNNNGRFMINNANWEEISDTAAMVGIASALKECIPKKLHAQVGSAQNRNDEQFTGRLCLYLGGSRRKNHPEDSRKVEKGSDEVVVHRTSAKMSTVSGTKRRKSAPMILPQPSRNEIKPALKKRRIDTDTQSVPTEKSARKNLQLDFVSSPETGDVAPRVRFLLPGQEDPKTAKPSSSVFSSPDDEC